MEKSRMTGRMSLLAVAAPVCALLFGAAAFGGTAFSVAAPTPANPLIVDVSSDTVLSDWLSERGAQLSGHDALIKRGPGALTVASSLESFDGTIIVEGGRLLACVDGALGTASGATYVKEGATLEVVESADGTPDFSTETFVLKGTGDARQGALYKNGEKDGSKAFGPIVLAGDAKVGSSSNAKSFRDIDFNGFDLTVVGKSMTYCEGRLTGPGNYIQAEGNFAFRGATFPEEGAGTIVIRKGVNFATAERWLQTKSVREWPLAFEDGASVYLRGNVSMEANDSRVNYWNGAVRLDGKVSVWCFEGSAPQTFVGKVTGPGSFELQSGARLYLENPANDFTGGVTMKGADIRLFLPTNGVLPAAGGALQVLSAKNGSANRIVLQGGVDYALPPLRVEAPLEVVASAASDETRRSVGSWRESIVKTDESELVYASSVGADLLDVRAGSVRLRPVFVCTGVPGLTETYLEGGGNQVNNVEGYPIGTTTNGVFMNARYASLSNNDFVNKLVGQKENTTWIYDGYLWIPGERGDPDMTWTWLAGVQAAMSVYIDGTRVINAPADSAYDADINVNPSAKVTQKNVTLSPGRHKIQVRCYSQNGWCGGYLWNSSEALSLTAFGLMVSTNALMTKVQGDYQLLEDLGDGTLLTATPEKAELVPHFAEFGRMKFASGTALTLEADYVAQTLIGFPSVTGNLKIDTAFVLDAALTPGRLSVNGTLTFGPDAVFSVANEAAFASVRRTYAKNYVLAEATSIVGCPKVSDALCAAGWRLVPNAAGTQLILSRNRGFALIVR